MTAPVFAAITLGSNSFNMLVARKTSDHTDTKQTELIEIVAKYKRKVRLAEGIQADGSLSEAVMQRGLDCLTMFAQMLEKEGVEEHLVAVIATATLRNITNSDEFCQRALPILSQPIEIISGLQEAEFIYQGMAATTPGESRRLVLDIGGASTEFIVGEADKVLFKTSLAIGCVTFNQDFFNHFPFDEAAFAQTKTRVCEQLSLQREAILALDWQGAVGASGAVQSVLEVLSVRSGFTMEQLVIDMPSLIQLKEQILASTCIELSDVQGLSTERAPTFASGVAILIALFELLKINELVLSGGALREGVLAMLARRLEN